MRRSYLRIDELLNLLLLRGRDACAADASLNTAEEAGRRADA